MWQYKVVEADATLDEAELAPLGKAGWELTAVVFDEELEQNLYYFKRPTPVRSGTSVRVKSGTSKETVA